MEKVVTVAQLIEILRTMTPDAVIDRIDYMRGEEELRVRASVTVETQAQ
jgi:hypothetical protein